MTPYCFEHVFETTPESFWSIYMDEAYEAERYRETGVESWSEIDRRTDPGSLTRIIQGVPQRNLPSFVKKFAGNVLGFTEHLTYDDANRTIQTRIEPGALPGLIDIVGTFTVTADSTGRAVRTCRGTVTIKVPLVGGRLEKFVVEDLRKSYEQRTRLMRSWLQRHPEMAAAPEAAAG